MDNWHIFYNITELSCVSSSSSKTRSPSPVFCCYNSVLSLARSGSSTLLCFVISAGLSADLCHTLGFLTPCFLVVSNRSRLDTEAKKRKVVVHQSETNEQGI